MSIRRSNTWLWSGLGAVLGFVLVSTMTLMPGQASERPDLSRFDADIYPAIDVIHRVPTVVFADETVTLEFSFACGYVDFQAGRRCNPEGRLYVGYGSGFSEVKLGEVDYDSLTVFEAKVPATSKRGGQLEYYLEALDAVHDVSIRYPVAGSLQPFVSTAPVVVELGTAERDSGRVAMSLSWGSGPGRMGLDDRPEQATIGPQAIDVTPRGNSLAVLDGVNQRVVVASRADDRTESFPVTARLGDLMIDDDGTVTVLDSIGVRPGDGGPPVPQLSVYSARGELLRKAEVFASTAQRLDEAGSVVGPDERSIRSFSDTGKALSRTAQREERSPSGFEMYLPHDGTIRLADRGAGKAFIVKADDEVGPISYFSRTDQGYVVAFRGVEIMRVAWFSPDGTVQRYVEAPSPEYAESSTTGRVTSSDDGTVFLLVSTKTGIEVLEIGAEK